MNNISDIAKELKISKKETEEILHNALRKCWKNIKRLHPESTNFERMEFLGRTLGVETEEDWPEFFYGFPEDIRMEVLESIKHTENGFKHMVCEQFMNKPKKPFKGSDELDYGTAF